MPPLPLLLLLQLALVPLVLPLPSPFAVAATDAVAAASAIAAINKNREEWRGTLTSIARQWVASAHSLKCARDDGDVAEVRELVTAAAHEQAGHVTTVRTGERLTQKALGS